MPGIVWRGSKGVFGVAMVFAALGTSLPTTVRAQTAALDIVEDEIILEGSLGSPQSESRRSVRLQVTAAPPDATLALVSEDLQRIGEPPRRIDRRHVRLANATIPRNTGTFDLVLVVTGIDAPGSYTGRFKIHLLKGDTELATDSASLTVIKNPSPDVQALIPEGGFQRANCRWLLSCWWARTLVHRGVDADFIRFHLAHSVEVPLRVADAQLVLVGSRSGEAVRLDPTVWGEVVPPAGATVEYPLPRRTLRPDSYVGHIAIDVEGAPRPATPAIRIDVRAGPLWASILFLIGIGLSRSLININSRPRQQDKEPRKFISSVAGFQWFGPPPSRAAGLLALFSGVPWSEDRPKEAYFRGITVLVLLVAALSQGLGSLYVGNATFGAAPLVDYAGVLLWPFTAEVVTRGLGNFKWPRPLQAWVLPAHSTVNTGKSTELVVNFSGGPGGTVSWTSVSSNAGVVEVDNTSKGCKAKGVQTGKASITVTVTQGTESVTAAPVEVEVI